MESHGQNFTSDTFQESRINQGRPPPSTRNNQKSIETELDLNNQFLNNQSCNNNSGLKYNNYVPVSFIEDNQFSAHQELPYCRLGQPNFNFLETDDFHQQFKQETNNLLYPNSSCDNKQEFLCANTQDTIHGDFSSLPISRSTESYESLTYLNETQGNQSYNLAQLDVISPQSRSTATSSNFLLPDSGSIPSAHQSPIFGHLQFNSNPNNSRNESLGRMGMGLLRGGESHEWNLMQPQFQGHRRTPSEYSDVSAASAQHSPSIVQQNSPMLHSQDSNLYQDVLNIGNFSLSDTQIQNAQNTRSPARSPAISPRLDPQQICQDNSLIDCTKESFNQNQHLFSQEPFPSLNSDMGKAQQMIPPEINVEFAPSSKLNMFDSPRPTKFDQDALTPPDKGRRRAFTDTTSTNSNTISRARASSCVTPQFGSSLSVNNSHTNRTLPSQLGTRISSPNRIRRQSTPSIPNRDYNAGISESEYQTTTGSDFANSKRAQKHPATFQCHLCPKRFTRAYNLRSHLRTHTDERPFICTVCSKAFARQHDRKRHEGLHSGEKKFICNGELKQGGHWGCGRRFARADALGRHFRSEAGRVCINLLLDEEARERERVWNEQQIQNMQQNTQSQSQISMDADGLPNSFILPAALIAQYPALATLSWSDIPQGDASIEDDPSGRSSFEASGSEYCDEIDESENPSRFNLLQQTYKATLDNQFHQK